MPDSISDPVAANDDTADTSAAFRAAAEPTIDTLFYDGQCPLCASEIRKLGATRGESLCLVDIHSTNALPAPGSASAPSKDALLRTLHLRRADGRWLTGADANVAAWENTPQEKPLRRLRWPLIRHLVDLAYALWAKWRYWRLYGAQFDEQRHAPDQN